MTLDNAVESLWECTVDLTKEVYEWTGVDMGDTNVNIDYRNYMINNPIVFSNPFGNPFDPSYTGPTFIGDPQEVDKYIDVNSNDPFARLPGPPPNSKILAYWKRGDVKAKGKIALNFGAYIAAQKMPIGSNMKTLKFNGSGGNSYSGSGNGLNNPTNVSFGAVTKMYGATGSKKMADGQPNAVFNDMNDGLAASMHFLIQEYHGKNICQLNNKHQGYVALDGAPPPKGIGDAYGMAALRLRWVTHQMHATGLGPADQLNMHDKETVFQFVSGMAKTENSLTFGRQFLERAWQKVKQHISGLN